MHHGCIWYAQTNTWFIGIFHGKILTLWITPFDFEVDSTHSYLILWKLIWLLTMLIIVLLIFVFSKDYYGRALGALINYLCYSASNNFWSVSYTSRMLNGNIIRMIGIIILIRKRDDEI